MKIRHAATRFGLCTASLLVLAGVSSASDGSENSKGDAREVLGQALSLRYETETLQEIEITVSGRRRPASVRVIEIASKLYDDKLYVLGRFSEPPYLRDTAFLAIEGDDSSDYFVYLPALRKVRRVSAFQRSDSWFETDLSFEDIERHDVDDYSIQGMSKDSYEGETTVVVTAVPKYRGSKFSIVRFFIAESDHAILRIEYLVNGSDTPSKVVVAERKSIHREGGALIPLEIKATNVERGSETRLVVRRLVVDPDISRTFFGAARLEIRTKLPFSDALP